MASSNPPKKNQAFIVYIALEDFKTPGAFLSAPTIAAGDFKTSGDDAAFANLATLPTVTPASSVQVKVSLSAAEMNFDTVGIACIDQTSPREWADFFLAIQTTA